MHSVTPKVLRGTSNPRQNTVTNAGISFPLRRILQLLLAILKVLRGDGRVREFLVANAIIVRINGHVHVRIGVYKCLLILPAQPQPMTGRGTVHDVRDMSHTVWHLLPDLVPVHEFVYKHGADGFHGLTDADTKVGAVGWRRNHRLVEKPFRLAHVEMPCATDHVSLSSGLARRVEVFIVVHEGFDPGSRCRVASGLIYLPVHVADVAAGIDGGFALALLDVWREPAVEGVVVGVCDGADGLCHDAGEGDESRVDDVAIALVLVVFFIVVYVQELVRGGLRVGRWFRRIRNRDNCDSDLRIGCGCREGALGQCDDGEDR